MLKKQTIHFENRLTDENTLLTLKSGDRYKLFKFDILINLED